MTRKPIKRRAGETYTVRAHQRRYPSKAKPHWFVVLVNPREEVEAVRGADGKWYASLGKAHPFLRNDVKRDELLKEDLGTGRVRMLRED